MKIKYQRTSTIKQHGNRFDMDTNKYDLVLFDQGISGTQAFRTRTNGMKVIGFAEAGTLQELIVEELRDIGRNTIDVLNTLDTLGKHNVNVVIRSMGNLSSMSNGKKNEIWGLITSIMSSLYAMEVENLKNRTKNGRDAFLMRGGKLGRKSGANETIKQFLSKPKSKEVISLLNKGKTTRDIAGRLDVSLNLVVKVRKHYQPKQPA
jgi:DNA invertase Pin-like site-specific DNA recombinase